MARPRRGTLKRRPTKQGTSYGVSFTYQGEEFYQHFGGEWEGWDEERAAEEQRFLMEKVNRGEWTPAKAAPALQLAAANSPTFRGLAVAAPPEDQGGRSGGEDQDDP